MGLCLCAFGVATILASQARLAADIDRELVDRAKRAFRPGPPRGEFPNDRPFRLGGRGQGPMGLDQEGFFLGELRRPRMFDPELQPRNGDVPIDPKALALAKRTGQVFSDGKLDEESVRIYTEAQIDRGEVIGYVQVAREKRDLERLWKSQAATLLVFLPGVLVLAGLGGLFLTGRAIKPIARMSEASQRISSENLNERLPIEGSDELAELGQSFNAVVDRLQASFNSLTEAYENQKRFTADASHELRTPLTRIRLAASSALGESDPAKLREALEVANNSADQMGHLVDQLLLLARADAGQLEFTKSRTDVRLIVGKALDGTPNPRSIQVESSFPDKAVYAAVDATAIERVIANLLTNAYRHSPDRGKVRVGLMETATCIEIAVEDEGEGISAEALPRIGERFFRVDTSRNNESGGTGLGLAISKTILESHGGRLMLESKLGLGTKATAIFEKNLVEDEIKQVPHK